MWNNNNNKCVFKYTWTYEYKSYSYLQIQRLPNELSVESTAFISAIAIPFHKKLRMNERNRANGVIFSINNK